MLRSSEESKRMLKCPWVRNRLISQNDRQTAAGEPKPKKRSACWPRDGNRSSPQPIVKAC
jgi:hypothetical protein